MAVNLSRSCSRSGSLASSVGFNPCRLTAPKAVSSTQRKLQLFMRNIFSCYTVTKFGVLEVRIDLGPKGRSPSKVTWLVNTSAEKVMFLVCLSVCLFVCRITQKLHNRFSENSLERWRMGHGRIHWIMLLIRYYPDHVGQGYG